MDTNRITTSPGIPTNPNPALNARPQEDGPRLTHERRNCMPDLRQIPQRLTRALATMCEPRNRSQTQQAQGGVNISGVTVGQCGTQQPDDQVLVSFAGRDSSGGVADDVDSERHSAIESVPTHHPSLPETMGSGSNPVSGPSVGATSENERKTTSSDEFLKSRGSRSKASPRPTPTPQAEDPPEGKAKSVASLEDQASITRAEDELAKPLQTRQGDPLPEVPVPPASEEQDKTAQAQDQTNPAASTGEEPTASHAGEPEAVVERGGEDKAASLKTADGAARVTEETSLPAQPVQATATPEVTDEPTLPPMSPHRPTLQGMPLEIQLQIMDRLAPQDLDSLSTVSHQMRRAVKTHDMVVDASAFVEIAKKPEAEFQEGVDRLISQGRSISVPLSQMEGASRSQYLLDACTMNRHAQGPNGEPVEKPVTHLKALSLLSPASTVGDIRKIKEAAAKINAQNPNLHKFSLNLKNSKPVTCREAADLIRLQAFTHLDLTGTRLDKGEESRLAAEFMESTRLSNLSLNDSRCSQAIVTGALLNINLLKLSLSGVDLSPSDRPSALRSGHFSMRKLTHLDVSNTGLHWKLAAEILNIESMSVVNLKRLDLSPDGNLLFNSQVEIGKALRKSESLTSVDLSYTRITAPVIASALGNRNIVRLILDGIDMSVEKDKEYLIDAFAANKTLQVLQVADTKIPLPVLEASIESNQSLKTLKAYRNDLGSSSAEDFQRFVTKLSNQPAMRAVSLAACNLGAVGAEAIAATLLPNSRSIMQINLQRNGFGVQEIHQLLDALPPGTPLRKLDLRRNLTDVSTEDKNALTNKVAELKTAHPQLQIFLE